MAAANGEPPGGDRVIVAVTDDGALRGRAARTSGVVAEALTRHVPGDLASFALARALTCAAVFPGSAKDAERIGLQWSGEGVLGTVLAEVRPPGDLRALVTQPRARHPEGQYHGRRGVGFGLLPGGFVSVVQQAHGGTFTQGQVELYNGEIDEDLEYWFTRSQQTPTRLRVMTEFGRQDLDVTCAGILVQSLGGAAEQHLPDYRLHERIAAADPLERLLEQGFDGRPFTVIHEHALHFACPCSRERCLAGIMLLEAEQILDMINEDQGARVNCDFCASSYEFSREDLEDVLARKLAG